MCREKRGTNYVIMHRIKFTVEKATIPIMVQIDIFLLMGLHLIANMIFSTSKVKVTSSWLEGHINILCE